MTKKHDGFFVITRVHRDDLAGRGFQTSKIDDATMERLASKMADAYLNNGFWVDLDIIAEDLGIPRHDPRTCENSVPCADCEAIK